MHGYKSGETHSLTRVQPEVMPPPGQAGQYTNKLHYLRKYLLDELITKKFAMDFMEPVDAVALQVPHYYSVITRPMDVGTIIKRVQNRYYHQVDELVRDFQLVISNCYTFNRPGDVVYNNCQKLEKFFNRVLYNMPRGEEKPSTKDPRGSGSEKNSEAVQRQCRELLRKLHISIASEDDKSIHQYFNQKLQAIKQKVDKFDIRTVEEFRFEVDAIFLEFDVQVRTLYEFYHRVCDNEGRPLYDRCRMLQDPSNGQRRNEQPVLKSQDISELLYTLKTAESSVEQCQKAYSRDRENRARDHIQTFYNSANKVKQKLRDDCMDVKIEEDDDDDDDDGKESEDDGNDSASDDDDEEDDSEKEDDQTMKVEGSLDSPTSLDASTTVSSTVLKDLELSDSD